MRRTEELPVVGSLLAAGPGDRAFDVLLLSGPLVIVAIILLGRTTASVALALAYVCGLVGYIAYKGLIEGSGE